MTNAHAVTAEELKQYVERAEAQQARIKDEQEVLSQIFADAKSNGYDVAVMKKVIARRKKRADEIAEEDAVMTLYCETLGMV
jgi:uncharacterized protein (UPF0335 family)